MISQSKILWSALKAEISYNRFNLILLIITVSLTLYMFAGMAQERLYTDVALPHLIAVVIMYMLFTSRLLEKRIRFLLTLPVSPRQVAVTMILAQIPYIFITLVLYIIYQFLFLPPEWHNSIGWRLFSLSSVLLAGNAAYCLSFDFRPRNGRFSHYVVFILPVVWTAVLLLAVLNPYSLLVQNAFFKSDVIRFVYQSPWGVLLQHGLAFAIIMFSIKLFNKRSSYIK